jgi:hypothetical protein
VGRSVTLVIKREWPTKTSRIKGGVPGASVGPTDLIRSTRPRGVAVTKANLRMASSSFTNARSRPADTRSASNATLEVDGTIAVDGERVDIHAKRSVADSI